jgi:hypothetical protein
MARSWKSYLFRTAIATSAELLLGWTSLSIHNAGFATRYQPLSRTAVPLSPPGAEEQALALLARTMDSVSKVERNFFPTDFHDLRQWVKTRGVLCGGMAHLYHGYLDQAGIPNRIVHFATDLTLPTVTHVTVEVALDGRWVLLDPTFHLRFWHDGRPLGARDLMNLYYRHKIDEVEEEFLGDVSYPPRADNYYIDYRLLPQHVHYVNTKININKYIWKIRKFGGIKLRVLLTPLVYFNHTSYYAVPDNEAIANHFTRQYRNASFLYFVAAIAIPFTMLVIFAWNVTLLVMLLRRAAARSNGGPPSRTREPVTPRPCS